MAPPTRRSRSLFLSFRASFSISVFLFSWACWIYKTAVQTLTDSATTDSPSVLGIRRSFCLRHNSGSHRPVAESVPYPVHRESHKSRDRAPCREPFTSPLRSSNISPRRILLFFRHPRLKGDLVRAPRTSSLNAEIYTRVCQPCEQLHGET